MIDPRSEVHVPYTYYTRTSLSCTWGLAIDINYYCRLSRQKKHRDWPSTIDHQPSVSPIIRIPR